MGGGGDFDSDARPGAWLRLTIGLAAVALARLAVLGTSYWDEIPYEPAPLGLEALAVLRGETPVIYWGQPYFGTFFSYVLAPFLALGADTVLTFGAVAIASAVTGAAAAYAFARRLWGEGAGLAALAYLALPSVYFSYHTLTAYAVFQALGAIACFAALVELVDRPRHSRWVWLCGLALGASLWCHQLGLYFAVAVGGVFLVAAPRRTFGAMGARLAVGFVIGSAPLLAWNALYDWITVRNFLDDSYTPAGAAAAWAGFWESAGSLVAANPQFWLDQSGYEVWMRYGEILVAGTVVFALAQGLGRAERTLRVGVGLMLTLFVVTAYFYSKSRWGLSPTFARYIMPLMTVVPVLVGGAVAVAARRSRALGAAVLLFALVPGVHDHFRYARWSEARADTSARVVIAALDRLGIDRAYAHNRISLPINFASRERIVVADYYGIPYMPYLNVVDDAPSPAIIAHETFELPHPGEVTRSLAALGGRFQKHQAGPFWVFHDFKPPRGGGGWLSRGKWKVDASVDRDSVAAIVDRDVLSGWSTIRPRASGDSISVDLGETHEIDEVHLLSAIRIRDIPEVAVLETSLDGESWKGTSRFDGFGWYWWNGHPKLDDEGRVSFYFEPVTARYLRVRLLAGNPTLNWSVTEIFVRAADVAESQAGDADFREGLLAERRGFVFISYHSLHARYAPAVDSTPWAEVAQAYHRAARQEPDDPDPAYRLGRVLWMKDFPGGGPDRRKALGYAALGLHDLAAIEARRCAEVDPGTFCADRALATASDEQERTHLAEIRRRFEPPVEIGGDLGKVELRGRGSLPDRVEAGSRFPVEIFWRSRDRIDRDLAVFVHAEGDGTSPFAADHPPANLKLPTTMWQPDETIRDAFEVVVPPTTAPGTYHLRAGLWDPTLHRRLRRGWRGATEIEIGTVEVVAPSVPHDDAS